MDVKTLAERLDQMPMFPYFTTCHAIVCTLHTRQDLGLASLYFSRKHPLACWLSTLLCIFSSTILTNFLLNEPVISALGNTQQVLWATGIWYLIFYSPFDIVFRICNFIPIKIILYCMFEIHNCKAIYQGIQHSSKVFPGSYIIMAFVGVIKGNGSGFTRMFERLIRGTWSMNVMEFMHPSYSTKVASLATIAFILNKHSEYLMISQPFVFFCVVSACIYFRLSAVLLDLSDPFAPIENLTCLLLFGGIWDALARAIAMDEQSQVARNNQLRAKAMRADILFKGTRHMAEKPQILTSQVT